MKELTIISGKGGTGKTSIVASFAALASNKVLVDADVDAADLHLVIEPDIKKETDFIGGSKAIINQDLCTQCGDCINRCRFHAISDDFVVDPIACEGCGVCVYFCPAEAIEFPRQTCGKWFVSETRNGDMVHAKLGIAEENSGLLVSTLRKEARTLAEKKGLNKIIIDGPPGIGCPVIAAITGTDAVLIITEPTVSGMHDMERVKKLADSFRIPTMLCINKYDLNIEISTRMKAFAEENNMTFTGFIPYDKSVTGAMVQRKSLVEFSDGDASQAVKKIWNEVDRFLGGLTDFIAK